MLTTKLTSCYNQLLATTVLYLTIVEPIQDLAYSVMRGHQDEIPHRMPAFVMASKAEEERDYYQVLGISSGATKHEINRAFRQLAKKYHPDKNKDKEAQDEFIKIAKAYETLSDEKKRKEYDQRSDSPNNQGGSFHGWTPHDMGDFDINEFFKQYEDQLFKHTQFHHQHHADANQQHQQQHRQQHQQQHHYHFNQGDSHGSYHGINLDNLFHDLDDDEFSFGNHFHRGQHNTDYPETHNHHSAHYMINSGSFGDGASFFGPLSNQIHDTIHKFEHGGSHYQSAKSSYSCHTVTKQVHGMMMTQTSCG